jgi:hypothetical protein
MLGIHAGSRVVKDCSEMPEAQSLNLMRDVMEVLLRRPLKENARKLHMFPVMRMLFDTHAISKKVSPVTHMIRHDEMYIPQVAPLKNSICMKRNTDAISWYLPAGIELTTSAKLDITAGIRFETDGDAITTILCLYNMKRSCLLPHSVLILDGL